MESLAKLENTIASWLKPAPRLPSITKKWLRDNVWWIVAVLAIACAVGAIGSLVSLFGSLATWSSPFVSYYASTSFIAAATVEAVIMLIFLVAQTALLAFAVVPLRERQKTGWNFVFASLLLGAVAVVVSAVFTLSAFGFITSIIFGAFWLLVSAYFIFEMRDQFMVVDRTHAAKKGK